MQKNDTQLDLPNLDPVISSAEEAFVEICTQWHDAFSKKEPNRFPPRSVDEIGLACLLLASEFGKSFSGTVFDSINRNVELCDGSPAPRTDKVLWELTKSAISDVPEETLGYKELIGNLNHHKASIRIWLMDVTWMARSFVRREDITQSLLANIAGSLAGPNETFALLGSFFENEKALIERLEEWEAETIHKNELEKRIQHFKEMGLLSLQSEFWSLEAHCRKLICRAAFE